MEFIGDGLYEPADRAGCGPVSGVDDLGYLGQKYGERRQLCIVITLEFVLHGVQYTVCYDKILRGAEVSN